MQRPTVGIALAVGLLGTAHGWAQTPRLAVGDPCPPLEVESFLKGDSFTAFEQGEVYVVEFWATWCAPCVQAMPHLSALQALYEDQGVTVLGINIRELRRTGQVFAEWFGPEALAKVEDFVERQGDRMAYTVAYDGATKSMDKAWMEASDSQGIPTTFVVDRDGTLAWIGHPMVLRMPLEEIVDGTWDLETGPERVKQAEAAYLDAMHLFASDAEAGLEAWEQAAKQYPQLANDLIGPKFDALIAAGLCEAAFAAGEVLLEAAIQIGDASTLNGLAWSIVDPGAPLATRDLDLALRAAEAAHEFTKGQDAGILDTLARVHFLRGKVDKAIELQSRAIERADESMKSNLAATLKEYRKARGLGQ